MTSDVISILQLLFTTVWSLFTSWYIPGTNVTPASFFFFLLSAYFLIRILRHYTSKSD